MDPNRKTVRPDDRIRHTARRIWVAFAILLLLQGSVLTYWGFQKQGYHVDEIVSYLNSSGYYSQKLYNIPGFADTWHTPQYFLESMYAHTNHRFSYETVAANVANDSNVHPPLFHLALHTSLSLFPETLSKWLGVVPNMLYFMVAQLFLFLISKWFLGKKSEWLALLPCLIWGFSAGAVSMVLFVRMYEILSMWILGLVYFHLRYLSAEKPAKWLVLIGIFSFLSFMTHYYATLFVFFLAACFTIFQLVRRGWKASLAYAASVLGGLGLMIACWPTSVTRGIIGSDRGAEATANLMKLTVSLFRHHLSRYLKVVQTALFDNRMYWIFLVLALLFLFVLLKMLFRVLREKRTEPGAHAFQAVPTGGQRRRFAPTDACIAAFFVSAAGLATFITIVAVAPYRDFRYISFLLPLLVIIFFLFTKWLAEQIFRHRAVFPIVMVVVFALITMLSYRDDCVMYTYRDQGEFNKIIQQSDCDVAVCFYNEGHRSVLDYVQFTLYDEIYCTDAGNIASMQAILADVDSSDGVIVYLDKREDHDTALDVILALTDFTKYERLYIDGYFGAYYFSM